MYRLHTHSLIYQRCESRRNQLKVAIVKLKMPPRRLYMSMHMQVNMSFCGTVKGEGGGENFVK